MKQSKCRQWIAWKIKIASKLEDPKLSPQVTHTEEVSFIEAGRIVKTRKEQVLGRVIGYSFYNSDLWLWHIAVPRQGLSVGVGKVKGKALPPRHSFSFLSPRLRASLPSCDTERVAQQAFPRGWGTGGHRMTEGDNSLSHPCWIFSLSTHLEEITRLWQSWNHFRMISNSKPKLVEQCQLRHTHTSYFLQHHNAHALQLVSVLVHVFCRLNGSFILGLTVLSTLWAINNNKYITKALEQSA